MSTLRERCKAMIDEIISITDDDGVTMYNDAIDNLVAFVLAEKGRSADPKLEGSLPLVMYCGDEASRQELIDAFKASHPGVRTKRMP